MYEKSGDLQEEEKCTENASTAVDEHESSNDFDDIYEEIRAEISQPLLSPKLELVIRKQRSISQRVLC